MSEQRGFRKLRVWHLADDLAFEMVQTAKSLQGMDRIMASQIIRAAMSTPANIAEGYARASTREYLHHLSFARGSLAEVDYYVHFLKRCGLIEADRHDALNDLAGQVHGHLYALIRSLAKKIDGAKGQQKYFLREEPETEYGDSDDEM